MVEPVRKVFQIGEAENGKRLDLVLAGQNLYPSRAQVRQAILRGEVRVNEEKVKPGYKVRPGDRLTIVLNPPSPALPQPEDIPLNIIYQDSDLLVVNKPRGLVVHPAPGHAQGTMVNALLHHCDDLAGIGGTVRPGIVHRLDKDTSGLLVVAKTDLAQLGLSQQLKEHSVSRKYKALVHGSPPLKSTVNAPIGRHRVQRKKMAVTPGRGKEAITHFRVLAFYRGFALMEARLETGRTHQVRVHLAHLGYPVVGDPLYGRKSSKLNLQSGGQLLHAYSLSFHHPRTGEKLEFSTPLPEEFQRVLDGLTPV